MNNIRWLHQNFWRCETVSREGGSR